MTRQAFLTPLGHPPTVRHIPVGDLHIDPRYQRSAETPQSRTMIAKMAHGWDWRLCMTLMVSERDDRFYVIDGQHRLLAARLRGDLGLLPCCIMAFDSVEEESQMFVQANKNRKKLTTVDMFRAAVAAGSEAETETAQLIADAGLKVSDHTNRHSLAPGALTIVSGVARALKVHGRPIVSAALTAMGEAFGDQPIPRAAMLFGALINLFHDDTTDPDLLAETLKTMTASEWTDFPELSDSSVSVRVSILTNIIREEMADMATGLKL